MNEFGLILKKLRKTKGLNQEELANILGVRKTTISNYETGYSAPSSATLRQIADYFSVSIDELLGKNPIVPPMVQEPPIVSPNPNAKVVPVYSVINPASPLPNPLHILELPISLLGDGNFIGLKVAGNKMDKAGLLDGSIAIIRKQEFADDGDLVLYCENGFPAHILRYCRSNDYSMLLSESSLFHQCPVIVKPSEKQFTVIGKVVMVLHAV